MITSKQKIELKKLLKGDYIADVKKNLKSKKITSKKGTPYSDKMISHIFNGRYQNPAIETAILEVYLERKIALEEDLDFKNKLLGLSTQ